MRMTRRSRMIQHDKREERAPLPKPRRVNGSLREAEDGVRREIAALLHAAGPMTAGEIAWRLGYPLDTIRRCLGAM